MRNLFWYFSIDAREHGVGFAERWSDESVFSGRAYFMPDKKPAELGVDHIRVEDAGIYRCRVDFQIGQTRNSKVNLTVIGKWTWIWQSTFESNIKTWRKKTLIIQRQTLIQNFNYTKPIFFLNFI